ncbi:MAG: GspH/FimT family pseudopilin [Hydrogenophaga sp.]|uniref:GspH/FimT family pseudopilin n=1 Tax=Hydrogenophaga sp. TaxID=1904254 RepID=UPI00262E7A8A|nr:GspH/FimT family pseudopilin [Hydrogenophaga sp.]MCW5670617.1 GspH/FimT family pseudopilin [Hydrogenophaga sp.]
MENVHQCAPCSLSLRQRGVTLIELMVGIALLAILLAIAAPNFQGMTASSRLTSASNELLGSLQQARAQAIRTGARVTVCKSTNGTQCDTTAGAGWNQGWIVFQDTTRSGFDAQVDVGETILTRITRVTGGTLIVGNNPVANYVSFAADGRPRLMGGAVQAGSLRVCDPIGSLTDDNRARDIVVTATGQVRVTRPAGVASSCLPP